MRFMSALNVSVEEIYLMVDLLGELLDDPGGRKRLDS
jgi:hypothetical protein